MSGQVAQSDAASVPTSSAAVVRTDLSTTTQVSGTLGYAGSYQVVNQLQGTAITALPFLGKVVRRGQPLYEVDGIVVPLFYGTRPMWRSVQSGISPGPDIYEIDKNLIALGYTDYGNLTPSNDFTTATAAAIDQWEAAKGLTQTGSLQLGAVAIEPGAMRVLAATANPTEPNAVQVSRPSDVLEARVTAGQSCTTLAFGLGAITLLVGGVGIANVMVISVLERRWEIGLRRALGATRGQVAAQFLTESVTLAGLGGIAGILIGLATTAGYAVASKLPAAVPAVAIWAGAGAAAIVGVLAGLYTALRAARLAPADTLRPA